MLDDSELHQLIRWEGRRKDNDLCLGEGNSQLRKGVIMYPLMLKSKDSSEDRRTSRQKTGYLAQFEFQISNNNFCVSIDHAIFGIYLY